MRKNYMDTKDVSDLQEGDTIEFTLWGGKFGPVALIKKGDYLITDNEYRLRVVFDGRPCTGVVITSHTPKVEVKIITVELPEPIPAPGTEQISSIYGGGNLKLTHYIGGMIGFSVINEKWSTPVWVEFNIAQAREIALKILATTEQT